MTSLSGRSFGRGFWKRPLSLAARNLGANVTSFDFDEASVWCTSKLKTAFMEMIAFGL